MLFLFYINVFHRTLVSVNCTFAHKFIVGNIFRFFQCLSLEKYVGNYFFVIDTEQKQDTWIETYLVKWFSLSSSYQLYRKGIVSNCTLVHLPPVP